MERQGGVPGSSWRKSATATLNGSKPQKPQGEEGDPERAGKHFPKHMKDKGMHPASRAVTSGEAGNEAVQRKAFNAPSKPPGRKKIKRPNNVYRLDIQARGEDSGHGYEEETDHNFDFNGTVPPAESRAGNEWQDPAGEPHEIEGDHEFQEQQSEITGAPDFNANAGLGRGMYKNIPEDTAFQAGMEENSTHTPQQTATESGFPDLNDHPINRALNAYMDPGNPLNPVNILAESLLPVEARKTRRDLPPPPEKLEELPSAPHPESDVERVATEIDARDAFWDFWLGHQEQMRRQCLRLMSGNIADAEDALSSAMLRASQKFPSYADSIVNGKAWLRKLVYNVCMDHYRQDRMTEYRAFDKESDMPATGTMFTEKQQSPEEQVLTQEQIQHLDDCIGGLSNNLRVPLFLRCVEGWSYPDIAAELNLKTDTVRKRIQLARDHLRRSNIR